MTEPSQREQSIDSNNDIVQDRCLQKVLHDRNMSIQEELEWLKQRRRVGEALEHEDNSWAMLAVNLYEKRTAILETEMSDQSVNFGDSSSDHSRSGSSGIVGWKGFLNESRAKPSVLSLQRTEQKDLEELEERQLVLKSLQDPQRKFEKAAILLFGRKDSSCRSQIQKRSGNILLTELQSDENESKIQTRVKKQSQSLVDAVFSVPSSRSKLRKKVMSQVRQEAPQKRLSRSANSSVAKFDADSSSGHSTKSERKTKRKKLRQKYNTLPYTRGNGENHSAHKRIGMSKQDVRKLQFKNILKLHQRDENDTLEEESEVESVSSVTTLLGFPTNERHKASPSPHHAPSPLQASSKSLTDEPKAKAMHDSTRDCSAEVELSYQTSQTFTVTSALTSEEEVAWTEETISKVRIVQCDSDDLLPSSNCLRSQPQARIMSSAPVALQRQESSSSSKDYDRSLSDSSTASMTNSSIKSSDGDLNEDVIMFDSTGFIPEEKKGDNDDDDIPLLPPINGVSSQVSFETTVSWLDKYSNELPSSRRVSLDSMSSADESGCSPQISDVSFTTNLSDPGITPFLASSDVHPLSSDFIFTKWKGSYVAPEAWADPDFKEYSNTLDHEPTDDDVVLYRISLLSEATEKKFGEELQKIKAEAVMLTIKDQLSDITFSKLSHKLALAAGVKEGAMLVALLGRSLLEMFPKLHEKIADLTAQAVEECYMYSTILDVGIPTDFSEFRSDYDDWDGVQPTEEFRKSVLSENAPFIVSSESVQSPPCNEEEQVFPSFPPDPQMYKEFLMLPRPAIRRSRSVEVLFIEEPTTELEVVGPQLEPPGPSLEENGSPYKFKPPKRTFSESSIRENDTRKSSICSVFESVTEEGTPRVANGGGASLNGHPNVIKAGNRDDVWGHLKEIERGKMDTLTRPIILSTSSTDSIYSRSPSMLLRRISQDSTTSTTSSLSETDPLVTARNGSQSPSKARKISQFERIHEEECEIQFSCITMIKTTPAVNDKSIESQSQREGPDEREGPCEREEPDEREEPEREEPVDTDNRPTNERRRSSAEVLADVLAVGIPLAFAAFAFIRRT